jgi:hypothetical protein
MGNNSEMDAHYLAFREKSQNRLAGRACRSEFIRELKNNRE